MLISDITPSLAFYGLIPRNSSKERLGVVLLNDETDLQYCYCTSQAEKVKRIYPSDSYFEIKKEEMGKYFPNNAKDSYIILTKENILGMMCITFVSYINDGEFELRGLLDSAIFKELLGKILKARAIPPVLKECIKEYFNL